MQKITASFGIIVVSLCFACGVPNTQLPSTNTSLNAQYGNLSVSMTTAGCSRSLYGTVNGQTVAGSNGQTHTYLLPTGTHLFDCTITTYCPGGQPVTGGCGLHNVTILAGQTTTETY